MFYSHEILSSSQYGVSTIWLIATVGKATNKKVTRKAIQEVNVPKACGKIIDPGAPLALRLQGNLLYGVSRVFSHQCNYVLSDAEKTQSDMMTFFRVMKTSDLDPKAGKAKRHQITLQDDPTFDPLSVLPNLDLLNSNLDLCFLSSQRSTQKESQMTPLGGSQASLSSGHNNPLFGFDMPPSSHSAGSYHIPSDFGQNSPFSKINIKMDPVFEAEPLVQEDLEPFEDLGINFDAHGNLVEDFGEPELPTLPQSEAPAPQPGEDYFMTGAIPIPGENPFGEDNMLNMDEMVLPDAEPFPKAPKKKRSHSSSQDGSESTKSEQATAPAKRGRRRKIPLMLDRNDRISAGEFRNWTDNYVAIMDASRKKFGATTLTQARKNAITLLFDNGICGVGISSQFAGLVHPLAEDFAGESLKARLDGHLPEEVEGDEGTRRGVRRTSAEAFDAEGEGERRVKQKTDMNAEFAHGLDDHGDFMMGDETAPELGMEAPAVDEHHSSSMMPWSRPPSIAPGSSLRGLGSVQKGFVAPSPLIGRGSAAKSIERYSDVTGPAHGSDDFAALNFRESSADFGGDIGPLDFTRGEDTQSTVQGLDVASQDFLGYATAQAQSKGTTRPNDKENRRWVDFEELASPNIHTKSVAAHAFLHVLSLATKNALAVKQDGIENMEPFGTINIAVKVPEADELAG